MSQHETVQERLDRATAERLAKLAVLPVDTARLERRLGAALDEAAPPRRKWPLSIPNLPRWSAWSGVAAAILLIASLLTFSAFESPAIAAPPQLARLHQAMASGHVPVTAAKDAAAIRRLLAAEWRGNRTLQALPEDLIPVCCLSEVGGEPVLGALIEHGVTPVSVVVADAKGIRPSPGDTIIRGDRQYIVHHADGTNMVMTEANGRFLCFMGSAPTGELVDLAERALAAQDARGVGGDASKGTK